MANMRNLNLQDRVTIVYTNVSLPVGTEGTVTAIDHTCALPYEILMDTGHFYVDIGGNCLGGEVLFTVEPIES